MSELIAAPADPRDVVEDPEHVIEAVSQPTVVITAQQLAFSTAAAVPLPRTKLEEAAMVREMRRL